MSMSVLQFLSGAKLGAAPSFPCGPVLRCICAWLATILIGLSIMNEARSDVTCNPIRYSTRIVDETSGSPDPSFEHLVVAVTSHILARVGGPAPHQVSSDAVAEIQLIFIHRPLLKSAAAAPGLADASQGPRLADARHLDNPWVKLTIGASPSCLLHAAFLWNERQILLDQALMSGTHGQSTNALLPIEPPAFARLVQDYVESVLLAPSPEARSQMLAEAAKRIPPDVLWLFRHAWQSTRAPFSTLVASALTATKERASTGYTEVVKALVDRSLDTTTADERYASILDLEGVVDLGPYRISRLN